MGNHLTDCTSFFLPLLLPHLFHKLRKKKEVRSCQNKLSACQKHQTKDVAFKMPWWDANVRELGTWNINFHALESLEKGHIFAVGLAEHSYQRM